MDPFARSDVGWTAYQLAKLNIAISSLPPAKFFPTTNPSLAHIDRAILSSLPGDVDPTLSDVALKYLDWIDLVTRSTRESFLTGFVAKTLRLLDFDEARGALIILHYPIPLITCGKTGPVVQTNLCLIDRQFFILLVLINNKTNRYDAEPQVIAGAIAAFQFNNKKREDLHLDPLDAMTIPCITMTGTHPDFYLVPVTTALSNAVITDQRPATQTEVLHCPTEVPRGCGANAGMEDPEYRKLALKRFLAFKELAQRHWALISKGV